MAKTRQLRLLVIRSGHTEWDQAGRLGGCADLPLSDQGRAEVLRALAAQAAGPVTHAFTSDDEASAETCALVVANTGVGIKRIDDLREVSLGLWEGSLAADLEDRCPTAFRRWSEDPISATPPEGEPLEDAAERLWRQVGRLVDRSRSPDAVIAVVVRPLAWGVLECLLTGRSLSELWSVVRGSPGIGVHDLEAAEMRDRAVPIVVRSS